MALPDMSVVIPVFNEEQSIPILLAEIRDALSPRPWSYEIIAVDDGSRDGSREALREATSQHPSLRVLYFDRNSGQTAALDAGWRASRGRFIVSLDADLQNDPADIPGMMDRLSVENVDMVIGVRVRRQDSWSKRMQSKIGNGVRNWITGDRITDTGCSLKILRRECIDPIRLFSGMHRFLPTLVRMQGYRVLEMPVNHRPRRFGASNYGALNRGLRGLVDCFAVRWMGKRILRYNVSEERAE